MPKSFSLLNIEDSEIDSDLIARLFRKAGYEITFERVETAAQMRAALKKRAWDIIISDHSLPQFDSYTALTLLHEEELDIPFIVVSGTIGEEAVADMMKAGAHDFLVKDNLTRLLSTVERELEYAEVRRERKQAEEALQKSQERFVSMFHSSPAAMSLSTAGEGRYVEVNDAFLKIFESTREQVIGHTVLELNTWVDLRQRDALYAALKPHGKVDNFEMALRTRTGKVIELLWSGAQMVIDGQDCLLGSALDITERKQAEKQIAQLNRLYATLSQVNQTIVRARSHYELYQMICNVAVEYGGFALVWVGLLDEVTGDVKPVIANGLNVANWPLETVNTKQGSFIKAPIATALRTSRVVTSEEMPADQRMQNVHFRYQNHTYLSTAAVPFRLRGQTIGVVSLVSDEAGFFKSGEEIRLLDEMGLDISFALDTIETEGERKQAEEKFRLALESAPNAIIMVDQSGGVVLVNSMAEKYFGYAHEELMGKTIDMLVPVRFRDHHADHRNGFNAQPEARAMGVGRDLYGLRKDGIEFPIEIGLTPIETQQGMLVLATIVDITERKQSEKHLQESNERFRQLWEATVEGILIHDQGIFLEVNEALTRMFGYRPEELIGKSLFDFVGPQAAQIIRQKMKDGFTEPYEVPTYKADGTNFTVEMIAKAMVYQGHPVRMVAIRDVTARKEAERALVESEERLRQVWESTSDAMALSDANGIIFSINPAAADLYGYTPEKIIGQSFTITLPEEDRELALNGYKVVFLSDFTPPTFETVVQRADGVRRITESTLTFLTDASGQRIAMLTTFRDITERKRADEALIASEKRYRGLFEDSPISIWEEDFSLVKQRIDMLREQGVSDFQSYFASHIDEVMECASLVRITDVNKAALQMYQAQDAEQMLGSLRQVITANTMSGFEGELLTLAEGRTTFHWEGTDRTLMGKPIEVNLNWSVSPGYEDNYSKVIVSTIEITERKLAEKQTQRQLERLQALRTIDIAISSSFNLKLTLEVLLSQAVNMLNTDAAAILLFHPITKTLEYAANRGFRSTTIRGAKIGLGDGYAGRAILERCTVHIPNLLETSSHVRQTQLLRGEDFIEYFCTPLIVKGEVKGALEIFHRSPLTENPEWIDFLETLAGQAAIAIENSQLFDGLQRSNIELSMAYDATIEGWSHALDLRDKETEGHSQRVTDLTIQLAQEMGMGEVDLVNIRRGALLHDIGKMGVPDNILLKPGKLTDQEWDRMRQHPGFAYDMLSGIDYLKPALDIPYCHHEKWDGSGYPRGLKGEQIPLSARIFAVVDVWDALRSDRSYRAGWPKEKALEYINSESGRHFDPHVLEVFLNLIAEM